MTDHQRSTVVLSADAQNVSAARRVLREAMAGTADEVVDAAVLALSEIVTNAFVHTAADVTLRVWSTPEGTRVEVDDTATRLPVRRRYADTAGTGRGLQLIEEFTDRWGARQHEHGKTIWFEIGQALAPATPDLLGVENPEPAGEPVREVTLRHAPLLMHKAWQEHGAALLREYLLHVLEDDPTILDRHAEASEAMSLLNEQLPAPALSDEPDVLMAEALEPTVTADEVVLRLRPESVAHFATLDDLLRRAIVEARAGRFLGPATQPEIDEMRSWICDEVARQSSGTATATPWVARTDVRATLADQEHLTATYADLATGDEPLLATDEASIIVAASRAALEVLGYESAGALLGRRVIAVVPARFHQAHIAGTTLNATNGRDILLGVPLVVPMVRADGTEVMVSIEVRPERVDDRHRVFVARFRPV